LIGAAAVGNALHVLNHLYDDLIVDGGNIDHLVSNTLPLLLVTLLLVWLWGTAQSSLHQQSGRRSLRGVGHL
jgi:hypothetical protein